MRPGRVPVPGRGLRRDPAHRLRHARAGLKPGTKVPTGPGLSKTRVLSGGQVMRRAFELDAARTDVELGTRAT